MASPCRASMENLTKALLLPEHGRWSQIAFHLPGRTDNEIKNHWNSHLSKRKAARARANPHRPTTSPAQPSTDVPPNPSTSAEFESTTSPTSDTSSSTPSCRFPIASLESTELLRFTTDAQSSSLLGSGCLTLSQDSPPVKGTTLRSRPLPKLLFSEWLEPEGDRGFNGQDATLVPTCNLDSGLAFGFPGTAGIQRGAGAETSCHFAELQGQFGNDVDLLVEEGLYDLPEPPAEMEKVRRSTLRSENYHQLACSSPHTYRRNSSRVVNTQT